MPSSVVLTPKPISSSMNKTFLINLESRSDRLERMSLIFSEIGIEFEVFPAIDGKKLVSENSVYRLIDGTLIYDPEHSIKQGYRPMSAAEIGCYLSHLELWKKVAEQDTGSALIFEDDLNIDASISSIINHIPDVKKGWDYIKLSALGKVPFIKLFPLTQNHSLSLLLRGSTGMQAYYISPLGAQKLIPKALPITLPVDVFIDHFWHTGINTLAVIPYPVEANKHIQSSIESERLPISDGHKKIRSSLRVRCVKKYRKESNAAIKKLYFLIYAVKSISIRYRLKP